MQFQKSTFQFLEELSNNNDRDWFTENKNVYNDSLQNAKDVFSVIHDNLNMHDDIEKQKIYRIYRDVRFSKDKTPYNPRFATSFSRGGAHLRGGYFLQIKPNETMLGGGFWQPEKDDLLRIRKEFEYDDEEIRDILAAPDFKKYFGGVLDGEELKTAPKGFDKNHPSIDLIRKKGFIATRTFSNKEVLSANFVAEIDLSFKALRPFFDLMSNVLTTNLNGESLID
ncbi:DUF2461 domain-containing protein [Tenacibaculum sp. M341]|uniref:DUF2461 domain-containing protein n=1 Tax=Tenacibaculum sp. M341 TaxID=2530339 RepID=UPI0010518D68|nr:DUF2461 domain-containing protein [Tenacibaculum sp. M341]TCI91112.1 DUF2461 domain-containing protein [Tenacibaculum sp. M341]